MKTGTIIDFMGTEKIGASIETTTIEALKDLIVINNDRSEGYKTAAREAKESDLKSLFNEFSNQSKNFALELQKLISADEQLNITKTKNLGKLYRLWMVIKTNVIKNNRKTILSLCHFGEDTAKKTYDDVLMQLIDNIPNEALEVILEQRMAIQRGHDTVKFLGDTIIN